MEPLFIAYVSPRFRPVVIEMLKLPQPERRAFFESWARTQPDGDEIIRDVDAADIDAPMPSVDPEFFQGN